MTFTVSMQPGNNYRAGASCLSDAPEQADQAKADLISLHTGIGEWEGYDLPLTWSKMLTVWRKLWVEADSMEGEPLIVADRSPDWTTIYVTAAVPGSSTTVLELGLGMTGSNAHQYEGGRVELNAFPSALFEVIDNTDDSIEINTVLSPAQVGTLLASPWGTLKDDDPDEGLLPHFYTMSPFIKNAYKDAYIDIMDMPSTFNPNRLVPFDLYLQRLDEIASGVGWNNAKDVASSADFWVSLVVATYQMGGATFLTAPGDRDNDPDALIDNSTYPSGPYWQGEDYSEILQTGVTPNTGDWDSIIFRAAIVDFPKWPHFEDQTIAHEVGHSGGNVGTETDHHAEGGLMSTELTEFDNVFFGQTLRRFREAVKW